MATFGILADIHGNLEALKVVLELFERRGVERLICLGDFVGYNADPNSCVELLQRRPLEAICGNHDLIALRKLGCDRCADKAAFALRRTRRALHDGTRRFLTGLPSSRVLPQGVLLFHGTLDDVQEYMVSPEQLCRNAQQVLLRHPDCKVCFFGHTHQQRVYRVLGEEVQELPGNEHVLRRGPQARGDDEVWMINPGSVDAARKRGGKLAEAAIYDSTSGRLDLLQLPYDSELAERKARQEGYRLVGRRPGRLLWTARRILTQLPPSLVRRLLRA